MPVGVIILLKKDEHVFLIKRQNTGYDDGKYATIGGHLDGGETATQAVIRETYEEAGVTVHPDDVRFINVSHLFTNTERIHFAFVIEKWKGTPANTEPEKASEAGWFHLKNLPDKINEVSKDVINSYKNALFYTERGWEHKKSR